jgi:hypothetical protein
VAVAAVEARAVSRLNRVSTAYSMAVTAATPDPRSI